MEYKVMLSYSWENSAERAALASQIGLIPGVTVLFDRKHVGAGTPVHDSLSGLLSEADCIVALLTTSAIASKEVLDELTRAHERNKQIVPIVADYVSVESLPWFLREINFIKYAARDFDSVLTAVEATIRDTAAKSARGPKSRKPNIGEIKRVTCASSGAPTASVDATVIQLTSDESRTMPRESVVSLAREAGRSFFDLNSCYNLNSKTTIAQYVVDNYLIEGDAILLDAGSSVCPIANSIARKAQAEPGRTHFTVMTHNLKAFEVLIKDAPREAWLNVLLAGGRYDVDTNAFFGSQTVNAYADYFPRVVVLGVAGLVAEIGLFCHGNTEEIAVKAFLFRKRTRDRIILANYAKLGLQNGFRFGESNALCEDAERCVLVTDSPPSDSPSKSRAVFERQIQLFTMQGVEVIVLDVQ